MTPTAASPVVIDTPPDVWQLTYDDVPGEDFVDGLRLSTDCLTRRIIEPLDPARYFAFPEHLGHRGHGFERIMQEWLLNVHGVTAIREVVVPWEYGETHLDLFMEHPEPAWDTGGRPLQVELKANKDAQVRTENVRQVQRQMFAVERAIAAGKRIRARIKVDDVWAWVDIDPALYADAEWRIIVIDPTTWRIPNPKGVRVTISDDRRAELEAEWATMKTVMSRPVSQLRYDIEWPEKIAPCSCGKCDPETVLHALPENLVEHGVSYLHAMSEAADAEAAKTYHGGVIRQGLEFMEKEAPHMLEPGKGTAWVGGGVKATLSKPNAKTGSRSLRVTESDAKPSVQL